MKPPAKGTNKYRKIINRSCGGEWTYWPNGDDFDCEHVYEWTCDECPINIDSHEEAKPESEIDMRKLNLEKNDNRT
jgi:hypothetical protein